MRDATRPRRTWVEACVCGSRIVVRDLPVERGAWTGADWDDVAKAVSTHRRQAAHVAWSMGFRVRETVRATPDGLPIMELS